MTHPTKPPRSARLPFAIGGAITVAALFGLALLAGLGDSATPPTTAEAAPTATPTGPWARQSPCGLAAELAEALETMDEDKLSRITVGTYTTMTSTTDPQLNETGERMAAALSASAADLREHPETIGQYMELHRMGALAWQKELQSYLTRCRQLVGE